MTKKGNPETNQELSRGEKFLLHRDSIVAIFFRELVWRKLVSYYEKKYENNPDIMAEIDLITRNNKLEKAHFYKRENLLKAFIWDSEDTEEKDDNPLKRV